MSGAGQASGDANSASRSVRATGRLSATNRSKPPNATVIVFVSDVARAYFPMIVRASLYESVLKYTRRPSGDHEGEDTEPRISNIFFAPPLGFDAAPRTGGAADETGVHHRWSS